MVHLFIINPRSFKDKSAITEIENEIKSCFYSKNDYHIHVSRYPRDAVGVVSKHVSEHSDGIRVYAVGGDGILFDCLNGIVGHSNAELAAVPYGRSNDFARALTEGDIEKLRPIKTLINAPSILTDVIHCGSNYYLNFCAVGIESAAIIKWYWLQQKLKNTRNKWVVNQLVTLGGIISLLDRKLVTQYYNVSIDGLEYDGRYAVINFSNGPCYGGDKTTAPEAVFNDGLVDILLVRSANRLKLLTIMPGYIKGHYSKYPDYITHVRAQEVKIHSERPLFVNLDGECFLDTNITLRIMPSSVRIIAAGGSAYLKGAQA